MGHGKAAAKRRGGLPDPPVYEWGTGGGMVKSPEGIEAFVSVEAFYPSRCAIRRVDLDGGAGGRDGCRRSLGSCLTGKGLEDGSQLW